MPTVASNATSGAGTAAATVTRKKFSKSLGSLLRFMEGIEIIVELKNGTRHRGILTTSDEFMNLTLEGAIELTVRTRTERSDSTSIAGPDKQDYSSSSAASSTVETTDNLLLDSNILSSLDIRGANIRYIQFPDNANLTSVVKTGVERERNAMKMYSRGKRKKSSVSSKTS